MLLPAQARAMKANLAVCLVTLPSILCAGWDAIGPFGGSAAVVQVDAHHRGTVLAATSNAQLFRSDNDGDSWHAITFPGQFRAMLHAFVVDPQTPGVYLVGLSSDTPEYSGIFRSTDNGATWRRLPEAGLKAVWSIAISKKDSHVLAAGTENGVLLSQDSGESWTRVTAVENRAPKPVVSLAFDPTDSKIIYAGTPHLPWKTMDGGASWSSIHTGMLDDSDVFSIQVDASRPLRVFAGACSGIYRSANAGASWTKLVGAQGASYRTYQVTQDPGRPNILLAGTTLGLTKSVDGGSSWRKLSTQSTRSIAFDPFHRGRIFVATDEGLFRSDDLGESLCLVNHGFCNRRLASLTAAGKTLYVNAIQSSSYGAILRRFDSEENWEAVPSLAKLVRDPIVKIVSANSRNLYIATVNGILVSTDAGQNWASISAPSTTSRLADLLVPSADGHRLLVSTDKGVFQTDNAGQTWKPAALPDVKFGLQALLTLAPGITFPRLLLSAEGAEYKTTKRPDENYETYGLVATNRSGFLAATSRGLMNSDDAGTTWQPVPGLLGDSTVTAICKHPTRAGVIFASKFGVIFESQDAGQTWISLNSGNTGTDAITELLVLPGIPDRVFALTRNRGVYSISLAVPGQQ